MKRAWPWLALAPSLLLAASVVFSAISGNDKAPFVVLAVVVIDAIVLLAFVLVAVVVRPPLPYRWQACALAAAPLAYCVLVAVMARAGWVDSLPLLGFR